MGNETEFKTCPCGETMYGRFTTKGHYFVLEPENSGDADDPANWWWTGTGEADNIVDECHIVNYCPECGWKCPGIAHTNQHEPEEQTCPA